MMATICSKDRVEIKAHLRTVMADSLGFFGLCDIDNIPDGAVIDFDAAVMQLIRDFDAASDALNAILERRDSA